jgi:hypothetical protein
MVFKFFVFAILAILWWGALWLALPIGWLQGTMPSFVAIHIGPPLLPLALWWSGRRAWGWRAKRAENRAEEAEKAEDQAALEAAQAAHQKDQALRRVHVDCRAVWAAVAQVPDWFADGANQCVVLEQDPETLPRAGRGAALIASLKQVFSAAFVQCEAAVWLPVVLGSDDPAQQQEQVEQAWYQAVAESGIERFPQNPVCMNLPGSGELPDRLIALFEHDPDLPAAILVGMDSPLAERLQFEKSDSKARLGHAVVALLFGRSGLVVPEHTGSASGERDADPLTPYWEREPNPEADPPLWRRIPPPFRSALLGLAPFATLHRSGAASGLEPKRESVLTRQISGAIQDASVNAALRDLPFKAPEKKAGKKAQKKPAEQEAEKEAQEEAQEKPAKLGSLDLGWFVHNCGSSFRLGSFSNALRHCGCEIDPLDEASNMDEEVGDVGAARGVLMLAEALVRVAQLQKPALTAGFNADNSIGIGLACPVPKLESPPTKQT